MPRNLLLLRLEHAIVQRRIKSTVDMARQLGILLEELLSLHFLDTAGFLVAIEVFGDCILLIEKLQLIVVYGQ